MMPMRKLLADIELHMVSLTECYSMIKVKRRKWSSIFRCASISSTYPRMSIR